MTTQLAANVVDFGLWFHVRNANGTLDLVYPSGPNDISHQASGAGLDAATRFPEPPPVRR